MAGAMSCETVRNTWATEGPYRRYSPFSIFTAFFLFCIVSPARKRIAKPMLNLDSTDPVPARSLIKMARFM